jgi:hypothetical protein
MPTPQGEITTTETMNQIVVETEEVADDLPSVPDSSTVQREAQD